MTALILERSLLLRPNHAAAAESSALVLNLSQLWQRLAARLRVRDEGLGGQRCQVGGLCLPRERLPHNVDGLV